MAVTMFWLLNKTEMIEQAEVHGWQSMTELLSYGSEAASMAFRVGPSILSGMGIGMVCSHKDKKQ